jgi:decaprenylphospho-beta-D-ribofuranose 2-oxidase
VSTRPLAEQPAAAAPAGADPGGPFRDEVTGWGGGAPSPVWRLRPVDLDGARAGLERWSRSGGAIARGGGRSYGDAAQIRDGLVLDTGAWRGIALDRSSGTVVAQAGVTIGGLLAAVIPDGLIVPVVPGTQHVSIGGAIASDIHGKNHGTLGTFGAHVLSLNLLSASGEILELAPGASDRHFEATVGGMGLTGVIVSARIALRRVESSMLSVDTDRATSLDQALSLLRAPGGEHRVAWLDLLAGAGAGAVRGVVTRASHHAVGELSAATVVTPPRVTVPRRFPAGALRPSLVRLFNELRFRRSPRRQRDKLEPFGAHMFPLDGLRAWPRLYGPAGFQQYQLAVPPGAEHVLAGVIDKLAAARIPCYLAVLKDFGPAGEGLLSFPLGGWTLALDLPASAPGLAAALERCDELVAEAGGRVYFSKDARLRPDTVRAMYPRLDQWRAVRDDLDPDGLWRSDLAVRTGLVA